MFYKHPQMADGHLGKCKSCTKKDVAERYYKDIEKIKAYEFARNKTAHRRAKKLEYQRKKRECSPGVASARRAVKNAVMDGRLIRKPCEVCGNAKSEAHHNDYRKKLDVQWLCFKHHRQAHGQLGYLK